MRVRGATAADETRAVGGGGRAPKHLHYVSTLSVFGSKCHEGRSVDEGTPLGRSAQGSGVMFSEGYSQSKWVCEKLVAAAAGFQHDAEQRTHPTLVPCSIYRLGFVSWHSRTGACNPADWVTRVVRGVAAVHAKPTEREPNNNLSLAPVDYVAGTRTRRWYGGILMVQVYIPDTV